ncbi:hypothetical protein [Mycolicibacterium porcinum]|uniref:hypothetical protein n=1 Tax=Mycolicibacterium porcinum TaxID=39693 RepID=UPI0010427166|nr:hypothetical protein [Mycolicibacterium porcinum]
MSKRADQSAGERLRSDLDAALARAAEDQGVAALEFSEVERQLIATACEMADWAEQLRAHRDAELAGAARPTTLVRLSAEVRHCERMVHDLVARINFGVGPAKAPQQQRAARARWDRERASRPVRPGA